MLPQVRKCGIQFCYSWIDEYGFHEYFCEVIDNLENPGKIIGFERNVNEKGVFYQWNDELGYHSYYEDK